MGQQNSLAVARCNVGDIETCFQYAEMWRILEPIAIHRTGGPVGRTDSQRLPRHEEARGLSVVSVSARRWPRPGAGVINRSTNRAVWR